MLAGRLDNVSGGRGGAIWGVNNADRVFRRTGVSLSDPDGDDWELVEDLLDQVSAGGGQVWGLSDTGTVFHRTGVSYEEPSGFDWDIVPGRLAQISVGDAGTASRNLDPDSLESTATSAFTSLARVPVLTRSGKQSNSGDRHVEGAWLAARERWEQSVSVSRRESSGWDSLDTRLWNIFGSADGEPHDNSFAAGSEGMASVPVNGPRIGKELG